MQIPKPANPKKFWTLVAAGAIALVLIFSAASAIISAITAPEVRAQVAIDATVASSLYNRNTQALHFTEIAKSNSQSAEMKTVAAKWSTVLREQNKAIKAWQEKNHVQVTGEVSSDKIFTVDGSRVRFAIGKQLDPTHALALAFGELASKLDSLKIDSQVSSSDLKDVFKKIVELDNSTIDQINKLARQ